jgi:hypothetical protein
MFEIVLTVILVMPPNVKDIQQEHHMETKEACWQAAKDWLDQDIGKSGGVGFMAGCSIVKKDTESGIDN